MSNPNHFKVKRLLSGNKRYPKGDVFTARWFRGETGGFLEIKRPDRSYESWHPYKDWKRYFELVGSVDPSVPYVTPETVTRVGPSISGFTLGDTYRVLRMYHASGAVAEFFFLDFKDDDGSESRLGYDAKRKVFTNSTARDNWSLPSTASELEVPEVSTETLTETKENTMLKIVDCIEINGNKVSRMTVDDLIGYLKLERENLAALRDDLGETRSLLKNIDKLTAPYINNIARLTALIDEKAGAL